MQHKGAMAANHAIAAARGSVETRAFATVEVHAAAAPILPAWADLETRAPCSIYQTRAWLMPWIDTLGRKAGLAPLFVLARGADERPVALLCLGIARRGPVRVATWLGGKDANFAMPLAAPGVVWSKAEVTRLLREAARAASANRPDVFLLANQPFEWHGRANPFALLPNQASPSAAHGTTLPADAETLFAAKLSKATRKKLRKKEARLAEMGPLTHFTATNAETQAAIIDRFLALKAERFRARKIVSEFECPQMRAFIEAAGAPHGHGIELHALGVGGRIVAVYGGAAHAGQWSGMFNAFDADEEIAKSSPGDLLLLRVIAKACADGMTRFDLGIGDARYKEALCDETIPLFDAIVAMSARGRIYAWFAAARQTAKRRIKADPRLFKLAGRLRALAG